jgi:ankyrin repeat protein
MRIKLSTVVTLVLATILVSSSYSYAQYEIFVAANRGDVKAIEALLRKNPDLATSKSRGGFTPLHMAAINGHTTPLIKAVQGNHLDLVILFLRMGADVNLQDDNGANPLLIAEMKEYSDISALLIPVSNVSITTSGGATALHLAASRSASDVESLLSKGADINVKDNRGWTPLHSAVSGGQIEAVKLLIEKGADRSIENKRGETPLALASRRGNKEIERFLTE